MKKCKIALMGLLIFSLNSCKKAVTIGQEKEKILTVSTISGGGIGYVDGPAPLAQYSSPSGIVSDMSGNLFIADRFNHCIRKLTPGGIVSTFAGIGGSPGFVNGPGSSAQFSNPISITIDSEGNLYVSDFGNHVIRKITSDAVVSTFAGGVRGYADGTGLEAKFRSPVGLAVDASNNIYVADQGNSKIRKITPAGIVTTLASADTPWDVAVDKSGNVYFTMYNRNCVQRINTNGIISTYAGNPNDQNVTHQIQDGLAGNAVFCLPIGLTIDAADNIYVADSENQVIRKISPQGLVSTIGKSYIGTDINNGKLIPARHTDGATTEAEFYYPAFLTIDKEGSLYVSQGNAPIDNSIRKIALVDKPVPPPTQAEMDKATWNKPTGWK